MNILTPLKFRIVRYIAIFILSVSASNIYAERKAILAPVSLYWIGGSGDLGDPSHWSKDSGGAPLDAVPNENTNVIFDNNSGLSSGSVVTIEPGEHSVNDFLVLSTASFTLLLEGSLGYTVTMNIYGDLSLSETMSLNYNSSVSSHNKWNFRGPEDHNIAPKGHDLFHIQFLDENVIYNQIDNLTASAKIRVYAGTWNTNNHSVTSDYILFRDTNPSSNSLTKVMNAGTSDIICEEWDSKLTYGEFTLTGTSNIYAAKFIGSPLESNNTFVCHNIHLLEYTDSPYGSFSPIEHNNFECTECIINKIIIEDTGLTQLAGKFTVENALEVKNIGSTIAFNGGNGRMDEVVINGNVIVPEVPECVGRTVFRNIYNDFTTFIRNSGSLEIENAVINNIHTQGNAQFVALNSILLGSTTGWEEYNSPQPKFYVWIGSGSSANWDNPDNWELDSGGSNGCIPSIVDNVAITNQAISDINIPFGFSAECKNLIWKNDTGLELTMYGSSPNQSELIIAGELLLDPSAIISPLASNDIILRSNTFNFITTNNVQLPDLRFEGSYGEWSLKDKLNADKVLFYGGTLTTQGNDIETDYWSSSGTIPKHFNFGSSHIIVNGDFSLSQFPTYNVTVNEGTSLYECENFISSVSNMHDLKLNNTTNIIMSNYDYVMHDLILNTNNFVRTNKDIELQNLIFNVNDSKLSLDPAAIFKVNGGLISNASISKPGVLYSKTSGAQADITSVKNNICALGHISFLDINADIGGVFHAPQGIDDDNNSNINFDEGNQAVGLYWVGGSGVWSHLSNWSTVSGGCPTNKHPANVQELYFDDNGIFVNDNVISIDGYHEAGELIFSNDVNVQIEIPSLLIVDDILIDNGYVTFQNNALIVNNNLVVQDESYLSLDLSDLSVGDMETHSGVVIFRQGITAEFLD